MGEREVALVPAGKRAAISLHTLRAAGAMKREYRALWGRQEGTYLRGVREGGP